MSWLLSLWAMLWPEHPWTLRQRVKGNYRVTVIDMPRKEKGNE